MQPILMLKYDSFRLYLSLLQSHLPAYPSNLYISTFNVYTYGFRSIQRYRGNLLQLSWLGYHLCKLLAHTTACTIGQHCGDKTEMRAGAAA